MYQHNVGDLGGQIENFEEDIYSLLQAAKDFLYCMHS